MRPAAGELVVGDGVVVVETSRELLVGLSDGTGHGPTAAWATRQFSAAVRKLAGEPLDAIFAACHEALLGHRGAVALLARFRAGEAEAEFSAIGNVMARVVPRDGGPYRLLVGRRGILGSSFRKPEVVRFVFEPGDVFVAHSDGISSRSRAPSTANVSAQRVAEMVLETHGKHHDDASCLVVRAAAGAG